ncbi:hypothetical protein LCGC14_0239320 [marine sediment metagenome]|uniref:Glycosyltransferase subfamily 4-like N-terminal domain-containing protein n=1 Tax=marine sediment metagenome TaxID=412755 RepID=A0A0F9U877_9ZZZZ
MTWLFVTSRFPWPLTHGTWLRVYHLTAELAGQGDRVSVLSYPPSAQAGRAYAAIGVDLPSGPTGQPSNHGPARSWLSPHVFDSALAGSVADSAGDFDTVVLVREKTLQYSPEARRAATVVVDMVDDPVLERSRHPSGGPGKRARLAVFRFRQSRCERRFSGDVDRFVFVSPNDAEAFAHRRAGAEVACAPNGVDTDYFSPAAAAGCGDQGASTVVFLGNMAHEPNEQAATFLIRQIAPSVWAARPETRFLIVGANPSVAVLSLKSDHVTVTGYVADVRPYLKAASVVALPMQSGTGIKNKLLEAWAMGCPVTATSLACQGLPASHGENVLIADSAKTHADAICRLIADQPYRRRLGAAGRKTVEETLTWSHAADQFRRACTKGAQG